MLAGPDARIDFTAGRGAVSVTLPGSDWCEIRMGPSFARTFVLVTPRVQARRAAPNASQWQMDAVAIQFAPFQVPPDLPIQDPEALRARLQQVLDSGSSGASTGGFLEFARRPGFRRDLGPVDPRTRCVPLDVSGALPAGQDRVTGANPPEPRQFMMRARICLGPDGTESAAGLVFLRESTVGDAGAAGRAATYDALAEQVFASLAFGAAPRRAAVPGNGADCQAIATAFDRSFRDTAAMLRIAPEPGAPGAMEVAMGLLVSIVERRITDESTRQRCFTEVLRSRGFPNAPPYAEARAMIRNRGSQPGR